MNEKTQDMVNALLENDRKPEGERMTLKKLGERFSVSGPRMCQVRRRYILNDVYPEPTPEVTEMVATNE